MINCLRIFNGLKNVLIVGVYLTLVTFPRTSSAPTLGRMSDRMNEPQLWINPCGITQDTMDHHSIPEVRGDSSLDEDLISKVIIQAEIALNKANDFREAFAQKTLNKKVYELHNLFKHMKNDWMKLPPKSFGEDISEEHLKTLKLDETLLDVYWYLQSVAVGLEQVFWDQEDTQGDFVNEFREAQEHLKNVLCELQMFILERNLEMRPDIERPVMPIEEREKDNRRDRKIRDWKIFRDYLNTLEYTIKAFEYLKKN